MTNKIKPIKCPHCGHEYYPAEIFYPEDLIGHPNKIIKSEGKILYVDDEIYNPEETYICDECGNEFWVKASIVYETLTTSIDTFEEETTITIENSQPSLWEVENKQEK